VKFWIKALKITKNITIIPVEHYQRPLGSS